MYFSTSIKIWKWRFFFRDPLWKLKQTLKRKQRLKNEKVSPYSTLNLSQKKLQRGFFSINEWVLKKYPLKVKKLNVSDVMKKRIPLLTFLFLFLEKIIFQRHQYPPACCCKCKECFGVTFRLYFGKCTILGKRKKLDQKSLILLGFFCSLSIL